MPFNDFDFSGGFQPIESATFGVASSPSFYGSSPSDVDLAFGKGIGVDTSKYSIDRNRIREIIKAPDVYKCNKVQKSGSNLNR